MRRSTMLAKAVSDAVTALAAGGEPAPVCETLSAALEAYRLRPDGDKAKVKAKAKA